MITVILSLESIRVRYVWLGGRDAKGWHKIQVSIQDYDKERVARKWCRKHTEGFLMDLLDVKLMLPKMIRIETIRGSRYKNLTSLIVWCTSGYSKLYSSNFL